MSVSDLIKGRLGLTDAEPEPLEEETDLVALGQHVASREQVPLAVARQWIASGLVRIDADGGKGERVWKEPMIPKELLPLVLVCNQPSRAELARRKALRDMRQTVAEREDVAIGSVRQDGTLEPGAHKLGRDRGSAR